MINLWEVEAEQVFRQPLPSLLPFVPILKGGRDRATVQKALQTLRSDTQLSELETLLAFFASFVLDSQLVQQIMRWDMSILQESPWYQEILSQGMRQELIPAIELGLELKFGEAGLQLMPEISQIDDVKILRSIRSGLKSAESLQSIRKIYQPE